MEADDEQGTYRKVEDVGLYQGYIYKIEGIDNDKDLLKCGSGNFNWDNIEKIKEDKDSEQDGNSQDVPPTVDKKQEQPTGSSKTQNHTSQTKKDPTQAKGKIPQTGTQGIYIAGSFIIIVAAVVIYVKFREYRDIK